ncbi:MAG: hypothetical protein NTV94_14785 [Planctomycetota bacterium]|nr:hypothetical protein [Planctomycetota bacterium]
MQRPQSGVRTNAVRLSVLTGMVVIISGLAACSGGSPRYQGVKGGGVNSTTASDGCGVMMYQQRAMATQGRREALTAVIIEE